jgi:hypothetical protein
MTKTTMQTWHRFWRRSGYDRKVALQAAGVLVATRAGLRLAGFRRWQSTLAKHTPAHMRQIDANDFSSGEVIPGSAAAISLMVEAVARHLPFKATCLEKSLSLWWLLRRHRIPADLRIGVRKDAGSFEAHAWVEAAGAVLSESGDGYTVFVPLEGAIDSPGSQSH